MPSGLPKILKPKLPSTPMEPLKRALHGAREEVGRAGDGVRALGDEIRGFSLAGRQNRSGSTERPKEAPSGRNVTTSTSASKLTNDEILAYQNREIGRELWQLEKHLSQGCRIPDSTGNRIPCDCCEKGGFLAGLAYESIPIAQRGGRPSAIYEKVARWCEDLEPMVTVPAVEGGQYDYKKLSGEASALRKELMGTLALSALRTPKERPEGVTDVEGE